jgi:hypothetical protein
MGRGVTLAGAAKSRRPSHDRTEEYLEVTA